MFISILTNFDNTMFFTTSVLVWLLGFLKFSEISRSCSHCSSNIDTITTTTTTIIIIIIIILLLLLFYSWEFPLPALADCFSLEFEWQQISPHLQDSSHYSGRS